jgi:hypothetical protein
MKILLSTILGFFIVSNVFALTAEEDRNARATYQLELLSGESARMLAIYQRTLDTQGVAVVCGYIHEDNTYERDINSYLRKLKAPKGASLVLSAPGDIDYNSRVCVSISIKDQ